MAYTQAQIDKANAVDLSLIHISVTVTDEEIGALTPEGNLTLVDDYHTDYSDGSGQDRLFHFLHRLAVIGKSRAPDHEYYRNHGGKTDGNVYLKSHLSLSPSIL